MKSQLQKTSRRGFSLPEVAISVAIAALALVSLMGVIPGSLNSIRMAGEIAGTARMVGFLSGEVQTADWGDYNASGNSWTKVDDMLRTRWYFDDQANPVELSDRDFATRVSYVVRIRRSPSDVVMPGGVANTPPRDTLSIMVDVAPTVNPDYPFSDPRLFQSQAIIVSRQYTTGRTAG